MYDIHWYAIFCACVICVTEKNKKKQKKKKQVTK
jgi:hypothetical protein